jgi:hypothetical protein
MEDLKPAKAKRGVKNGVRGDTARTLRRAETLWCTVLYIPP